MKNHYKTIILSDLHLGIKASKAKEVVRFLKRNTCDTLILNGDIIDGWALRRSGKWKKKHTKFFKLILNYVSKRKSKVVYVRGNHDDFLDEVLPFELGNFSIKKYHIHESGEKRYFVTHGDLFDSVTSKMKWLALLGDVGYTFLLWLNRHYNTYREKRGLPYYSLSQSIKAKVKKAVSFIGDYEKQLAMVAKSKKCHGIICGHIHQPANKMIDDIHYLNSGDWVETLSALTEDESGNWHIIYYSEWEESQKPIEVITLTEEISVIQEQINQLKTAF
ncbi:MAG: UDP-2,3-diacylglucosamine diphosphatase [Bacteroidota bacterium]|jgi:UDP-2,3-diacylglucosamine pyrophosphatase LpxH